MRPVHWLKYSMVWLALWLSLLALSPATAQELGLPRADGLPVNVQTGVGFIELLGLDENGGKFEATIDLRLRWKDSRLIKADAKPNTPSEVFREDAAEKKLETIWVPKVVIANQNGDGGKVSYGLRIAGDGNVELLKRITGAFSTDIDVTRFPFDRQKLAIAVAVKGNTMSEVALRFDQNDIDFSRANEGASLTGWTTGLVDVENKPQSGWYNTVEARVIASLDIARQPGLVVASIFIPLIASLLIPLLALWLNRMEDGVFQIDTFELVNIVIGGLFTVIALNFTIFASYAVLSVGDNTVNRFLALSYLTLAVALLINIVFGRFNVLAVFFGRYVQEQAYLLLMWAVPVAVFVLVTAILLVAYV